MNRHAQIVCTLGPASSSTEMIRKMAQRGMNVARINFSHGNRVQHQQFIDSVRKINKKGDYNISILQDLEGYRIRVGNLKKNKILNKSENFVMSNEPDQGEGHIPFDFSEDLRVIRKGSLVFIDDGFLHLKITGVMSKKLEVKVVQGGLLKERKGINIPGMKFKANIMTPKDQEDLDFGIKNKVDMVAQSFVRNKRDIQRVSAIVKKDLPECQVISKIENPQGVKNLESIMDVCDGIMVARGDLGVTLPIYKIPMIQKHIIRQCHRKKKISFTATQMLDSMIENGRPTRAEVSDVANAILDGTDYVMLSGETAIGKFPSRCVQMMSQIIEYSENFTSLQP